jgi:hypothetical protein
LDLKPAPALAAADALSPPEDIPERGFSSAAVRAVEGLSFLSTLARFTDHTEAKLVKCDPAMSFFPSADIFISATLSQLTSITDFSFTVGSQLYTLSASFVAVQIIDSWLENVMDRMGFESAGVFPICFIVSRSQMRTFRLEVAAAMTNSDGLNSKLVM